MNQINNEQIKALKENVQYSFTKKQASLIYGQKIVEKNETIIESQKAE